MQQFFAITAGDGIAPVRISLLSGCECAPAQLPELPAVKQLHSSAGILDSVLHMDTKASKFNLTKLRKIFIKERQILKFV